MVGQGPENWRTTQDIEAEKQNQKKKNELGKTPRRKAKATPRRKK